VYRLPRERPAPPPYALTIGLDWQEFHTPPCAGGLRDQPIQLMKEIRLTLTTYNTINAYRRAQAQLSDEGFTKFCNSNRPMMKFMEEVWKLQEEDSNATDG
jgi:hypothetical protein